jgi:Peptidase family M23
MKSICWCLLTTLLACASPAPDCQCAPTASTKVAAPSSLSASAPTSAAKVGTSLVQVKDEFLRRFNAGDTAGVFALLDPEMKVLLDEATLKSFIAELLAEKGQLQETKKLSGGKMDGVYLLRAERGEWEMTLSVNQAGEITGLLFKEPIAPPPVAKSEPSLTLPFRGKWQVGWGGDTLEQNYHINNPSQRRAADLVMVDEGGRSFRAEGLKNEDYLAYGQELLAVAAGEVITLVDGVPDNKPGELNPYMAPGNVLIIKHSETLYSAYAHLIPGSAQVKVGDKVKQGQPLARCGNSGNSSETHLHFQLQDGPLFEKSFGVEAIFKEAKLTRGGATSLAPAYSFLKGDLVEAK